MKLYDILTGHAGIQNRNLMALGAICPWSTGQRFSIMAIDNPSARSVTARLTPVRQKHVDHGRLSPAMALPLWKTMAKIAVLTVMLVSAVALRVWSALHAVHAW
ncbi:MAG: hypothetical protein ACK4N1_10625 [Pseudorhizobium sp.]